MEINGAQAIIDSLIEEGVDTIFGFCLYVTSEKSGYTIEY